uniref:HAT C-terminal dimerisation domain-containing protein n=1 Tax=Maylandia zebra TaxID=106582 RepID=A0A3P9DDZ8_9CICH
MQIMPQTGPHHHSNTTNLFNHLHKNHMKEFRESLRMKSKKESSGTQANESCTSAAAADDGTFGDDEDENDTISTDDNSRDSEHEWPECWSQAQVRYFSTNYKWLISRNQKLGCSVCSQVCARVDMQQGQRVSQEWSGCLISSFGRDKAAQQNSLRKKIKEHRDSIYHKKAVEIKEKATQNTMQKHIEDMRKADYASTCNVFRTAYKIGKHGRPFTDMPIDVQLQVLNGVKMGRVLHSNNSFANILDHIAAEMKKKVVNDIVMNERKLCVLIDESTTISGKSVLVVCLRSAISSENPDTIFFELIYLSDAWEESRSCCAALFQIPLPVVWHCSNHRLELAVCDVLKEVGGINHFKIFLDQLYSLYHASPKDQRELTESAHNVGQRLLGIGRVLSVRWVASSERTVKAVWENYQALQVHFTSRAKYKGLNDVLTTVSFVVNLGIMYDALTELSDLSRMLQRRDMTLDQADRQLDRQIRVFESMVSTPGPYTQTAIEAEKEKIFRNVCLHENQRVIKINHGQFFRSLAENTDSHLLSDIKVLQSDSWPASLDIQYGDAAVRRLCQRFRVGERESVLGFREYKDLKASKTPAALKPLLTAVHTIAVSTSECERAFSSMNYTLTDKRNSLDIKRLSNMIFLKCNGPPLDQFNAQTYVQTWLALGRRSAASTNCEAQSERKVEPKTCWILF